ncbi:fimbrial protein [Serratia fonticola]|uniref:fimbrial protein n=1 Tax=Serratia fonticola TaxID=47917 RepID=UPI00217A6E17|nr:fimbrial protein [Serratia fonticola]CAI2025948.1 Minor fimbrial protein prsF precursor [Serratia fonticola]
MKKMPAITLLFILLSAIPLKAAENISFKGTLLEYPPCKINDGALMEINFGEVGVNKVDGENYAQTFSLKYTCKGARTNAVLRYMGQATAFDHTAVQSNIPDFGIRLRHQSYDGNVNDFEIGSSVDVPSYSDESTLIASPVKKAGAKLQEGAFTAAATLQLEYP